jgi:hypothetical protein
MSVDYKSQRWINASGTLGGHRAHLRKNVSLRSDDPSAFSYTILLSLIYLDAQADGTPASEEELTRVDRTEEAIADAL